MTYIQRSRLYYDNINIIHGGRLMYTSSGVGGQGVGGSGGVGGGGVESVVTTQRTHPLVLGKSIETSGPEGIRRLERP